jgi:hypothetical protein
MLVDSREHTFDRCIISERLALVREPVLVPRREDERRTQLERVFAELFLRKPACLRSLPRRRIVFAQQVKDVRFVQFRSLVGLARVIDQQREGDPGIFTEHPGVIHVAQSDRRDPDSAFLKLLLLCAQLRDVLAAEDSTIMAQKRYYRRALFP